MLRLNFRTGKGDPPRLILASFLRFCADGTLRGPENFVVARRTEGGWWVAGILHREFDCEGPMRLRLLNDDRRDPTTLGPINFLRSAGNEFHANDSQLRIPIPGLSRPGDPRELVLLSEGASNGKA